MTSGWIQTNPGWTEASSIRTDCGRTQGFDVWSRASSKMSAQLPPALPVDRGLEGHFLRQVSARPRPGGSRCSSRPSRPVTRRWRPPWIGGDWQHALRSERCGLPMPSRRTFAAATKYQLSPPSHTSKSGPVPTRAFSTWVSCRGARALLADAARAEAHFRVSIGQLDACGARLHLARSELVYGEWLRRQRRRRDAREQLEAARDIFDRWAPRLCRARPGRAPRDGAHARKRVDGTRHDLTPQESPIARLAADGLTNPEVAERLFISASTVDYHLRKVYRKLEIRSRHELGSILVDS